MIKFACSKCGKPIRVDDKYAEKKGKCPGCGETVVVPGQAATIAFRCAGCGHPIKVPESYAGKKGKCPKCKEAVVVPAAKTEPMTEAQGATVTCPMCGQAVRMADESVECPECGSLIDAASGQITSPYDDGAPAYDEDAYEESDEPDEESAGLDRRLILIISGVAAIVIVGLIGLVVALKSGRSAAADRLDAPPTSRRIADTNPAPQPTRPAAPSTDRPADSPADSMVQLRFAPTVGTKRTVRVTTQTKSSHQIDGSPQYGVQSQSLTFELEVTPSQADGTVPITVTLAALQARQEGGGATLEYDSAQPLDSRSTFARIHAHFVGKRCVLNVSERGEIDEFALDELYRAIAEERLEARGNKPNPRYNSREEHLQAMKTGLENSVILGKRELCDLLDELVAFLPSEPLREGDTWSNQVAIDAGVPLEMATTYTLTASGEDICTINAEGQRSAAEAPIVRDLDTGKISYTLAGASEATLTVDRRTGWLLSKEQKTNLSGQTKTSGTGQPDQDVTAQVSLEITTTVTTVE